MASKAVPGLTKRIASIPNDTLTFFVTEWQERFTEGKDIATLEQQAKFFEIAFQKAPSQHKLGESKAKKYAQAVIGDFSKGDKYLDKDGFVLFLVSSWAVDSIQVCEMEQGLMVLPEDIREQTREEFLELIEVAEVDYLEREHLKKYFESINRHWSDKEASAHAKGVLQDFSDGECLDEQGFVLYYQALWGADPAQARKDLKRGAEARTQRNSKNAEELERRRKEKKRKDMERQQKKRTAAVKQIRSQFDEESRMDYEDQLDIYEETGKGDIDDIRAKIKDYGARIKREAEADKLMDKYDPDACKAEEENIKQYIEENSPTLSELKDILKKAEKKAEAKALREAMGMDSDDGDSDMDEALTMTAAEAEAKFRREQAAEKRRQKDLEKKHANDAAMLAKLKREAELKKAEMEKKRKARAALIAKAAKHREERLKQIEVERKRKEAERKRLKEEAKRKKKEERERKKQEYEERKRLREIEAREKRARERREEAALRKEKEKKRREEAKRRKKLLKEQKKMQRAAQKEFEKKIKAKRLEKKKREGELRVAREEAERKRRITERARMACQITVSEAGAFNVNMSYDKVGEYNGKPYWRGKNKVSGDKVEIFWSKEDWRIMRLKPATVYYVHADDTEKPPSGNWKPLDGSYAPVPKLQGDTNDPLEPIELDEVSADLLIVRDIMAIWDDNENHLLELNELVKMWWMLDGVRITKKVYNQWCQELNDKFEGDENLMKDKTQKVYPVEPERGLTDRQVLELYSHLGRDLEADYELAQREDEEREFAAKVVVMFRTYDEDEDGSWDYAEWARFMWMCHGIEYPEEKYNEILRLLKVPQLDLPSLNMLYFEHIPEQLHENFRDVVLRPTVANETRETLGDVVQAYSRLPNKVVDQILSFVRHRDFLLYHEVGVRHEIIVYDENGDRIIKEYFKPVPWLSHTIRADGTLAVATREYDKSHGEEAGWREYYCVYTSDAEETNNFLSKIKSLEPFEKIYPDSPDTLIEVFPDKVFLDPRMDRNQLVFVSFMHGAGLQVNRITYTDGNVESTMIENNIEAEAGRLVVSHDKTSVYFLYQKPYEQELYIARAGFGDSEFEDITEVQWFPELNLDSFVAECLSPDEKILYGCVQINMIYHILRIDVLTGELLGRNAIGYGLTKHRPPASKGLPKILVESLFYSTDGYVVVVMNHEGRIAYFEPTTLKEERFRSVDFPPSEHPVDISLMTAKQLNLEYFSIRNPIGEGFRE